MKTIMTCVGNNPCKDCVKRSVTCHGTCQDYAKWKKLNDENNKRIRMKKLYTNP